MNTWKYCLLAALVAALTAGCNRPSSEPVQLSGYGIYVTNEASGDLSVIDSATHTVVATVPLGKRPRGIHASPDRQTIYVALSGSPFAPPGVDESTLPPADKSADGIGVFDVRTRKLLRVIEGGSDPEQFDLSKDGKLLYVSNEDVAKASIVDVASGKVNKSLPVAGEPEGVTTAPDGRFVYVTCEDDASIFVIDTAAAGIAKSFKVGRRPRSVAFLRDGSRAYVTNENDASLTVVDAARHEPLRTISLGGPEIKPMGLALSPDSGQLYVSTGRGRKVFVLDTATEKITASFEVGQRPWGIAVSPDGKTLYTANGPANDVSVIDLATNSVTRKITVGDRPWGVITLAR
jgi:YVTN family beta-propeller protein